MTLLSVVVPCYNEQESLQLFYDAAVKVFDTLDMDYEIILVNDGSRDRTLDVMLDLYHAHPGIIKVVNFSRNFGKEGALLAGLEKAKGDYVTVMDADLQDPPEYVPKMFELMEKNNDDIVGSRRVSREGEPPIRSFFARNFYKIINHFSDVQIVDGARDFRLMKRKVVDSILSLREYNRFSKGMFVWVGYKAEYLEYENIERVAGETSWSFWKLFRYALDGIIEYTNAPLRAAAWLGGFMTVIFTIEMIVLLILALIGKTISNTVLILSVVLFIGSILILFLGIIGEYLAKTYDEVRHRPQYIVKDYYE
ncbi:MAG: glycosyltransferase family 2 protein [Solobacterium sp.]|nr:glycosyltransferase family 2 protein [Solobacterium sp.]